MKKIVSFLMVILFLFGCAMIPTTAKYEAVLKSWLNADINRLTDSWGYPSSSFVAPNGNTVYVYQNSGSYTVPTTYKTQAKAYGYGNTAYGTATTNVYGGQTVTEWCRTFFEVDSSNRIVRWRWQGNNCTSR